MDDEKIGAFLDGELTEQQRREAEQALIADTGAALRLNQVRHADDVLRAAFRADASPCDDALAQRLLNGAPSWLSRHAVWARRIGALAAACAVGVWLGASLAGRAPAIPAVHEMSAELAAAIEQTPSAQTLTMSGRAITLAQTIRTNQGYCRELRVGDEAGATDLLACLDGGAWRVVVAEPAGRAPSEYSAAGSRPTALESALNARGGGAFVDQAEERELIRNRWRAHPSPRR